MMGRLLRFELSKYCCNCASGLAQLEEDNREYQDAFEQAVNLIIEAQYEAIVRANYTLLHRNWRLGALIIEKSK